MGWKEGGLHAFEAMLGAASNTFSYLRIWALNIADFFFKFALITSIGAIPGAILGNLLVMIIEGLIVFVQTLRLHWVEWFSKFYEGGGSSFAPYREPTGWIARVNG
jgi:V/A-type H+-transporting ATPase subunit I